MKHKIFERSTLSEKYMAHFPFSLHLGNGSKLNPFSDLAFYADWRKDKRGVTLFLPFFPDGIQLKRLKHITKWAYFRWVGRTEED
jgi:hypothetical protein